MDNRKLLLPCESCGKTHPYEIDFDSLTAGQKGGVEPLISNFICPDSAWMYRVLNFAIDTRARILNNASIKDAHSNIVDGLRSDWGAHRFDDKLKRFKDLDLSFLGIPEEYYNLLWDVVSSYCCGRFYPAMTSAGALGERILNRLLIKTRAYFKSSNDYKKIYRKDSFENWDEPIRILNDWQIIDSNVVTAFKSLKKFRNDSIHYSNGYNFEANSHDAVAALSEIIDKQFNYERRTDLFWVFDVPGEIFVRSEKVEDPFVKEFVIPNCALISPLCEPTATPPVKGKDVPQKPLTDEDFLRIRRERDHSRIY